MQEDNYEKNIRNFAIISHIDHGKSTLADRFLELTNTVEKRKMREQYLDQMDLEREKGITIKMQPVRLEYSSFILNLIDTPGHIDFSYEVSRSLKAVEGAVLLVDATQGVQAQTITNLDLARTLGLKIIPVVNKIDSALARVEETKDEIVKILKCSLEEILEISAKTGQNVDKLLEAIISRVPPPLAGLENPRALVFDFEYSLHRGVILYVRLTDGALKKGDKVFLYQADVDFTIAEVGVFKPASKETVRLKTGEIGYVVTNIKNAVIARVGDTLLLKNSPLKYLEGYKNPSPVVWASVYPESQNDFVLLKQSLERLKLSDSALSFEEESSGVLGRGFRCGFLGMLHLEIVIERLRREFDLKLVVALPTVVYKVENIKGEIKEIYSPALLPEHHQIKRILEPWVDVTVITPFEKLGDVTQLLKKHNAVIGETGHFGENRLMLKSQMALREMMKQFFEEIKSITAGYASFSYEMADYKEADLVRLDVLLNDNWEPAFSRIVKRSEMERESQKLAEKLRDLLPKVLIVIKIQVKALGRILAARSISALKKDVAGYLYGGDRTRKMKLWQKQKKGKEKMQKIGKVNVPADVFLKMIQGDNSD
ncbi:MAG: translation elongation factor 4 [bacterium]|nr:translation elongation factor 4 [bacterium]